MSRNARNITSWIALGAMLLWSLGIDCCCLGTGCCGCNDAATEAEGPPGGCCCPVGNPGTSRTADANRVAAEEPAARLCDCDSHDGNAIVVTATTTLSPPEAVSESPSCEELPVLVTETDPTFLPTISPTPPARGPPGATVLS